MSPWRNRPSILNQSISPEGIQRPCTIPFLNTSSSTDQRYTMASIHDQLQCCLLFPRTQQRHQQTSTQTRDPRRRQTKYRRGQHKNQDRLFQLIRIFHRKIGVLGNWNCHQSVKVSNLLHRSHSRFQSSFAIARQNASVGSTFAERKLRSRR